MTIPIPLIVNHIAPFFSINLPNLLPKIEVKYETKKNLSPLVNKQISINTIILKFIIPLVIVKTLKGRGVNPAKNIIPNHK